MPIYLFVIEPHGSHGRRPWRPVVSVAIKLVIWNIMGTLFVIIFAVIGTKCDHGGKKFDERGTKYNPEVINYKPS